MSERSLMTAMLYHPTRFVSLDSPARSAGPLTTLVGDDLPGSVDEALALAVPLGEAARGPGTGATADLWRALATVAAHDLGAARAIEPHLDALAILEQAGLEQAGEGQTDVAARAPHTWGVFAAEGGDDPLTATHTVDGWQLSGTKPWCSLADRLDRALVSAHADGARRLFRVDLAAPGVHVVDGAWHARGLTEIPSGAVRFDAVLATPVGEPGWYLSRPGFAWGGIGVAACWYGAAVGIARSVFAVAAGLANPDDKPFVVMHLGAIDELLETARRALAEAAALIDGSTSAATGAAADTLANDGSLLALRVRATVARACEEIIDRAGHALGPAALALDPAHAKRVADLQLYVRQHHAERDQQALGRALLERGDAPW